MSRIMYIYRYVYLKYSMRNVHLTVAGEVSSALGPGQRSGEGRDEVEERPGDDDVVVDGDDSRQEHLRGANSCLKS